MRSMTGYGYGNAKRDEFIIEVELKSYNNRYLEFQDNINFTLSKFEPYINQRIKEIVKRGHVDVIVKLKVIDSGSSVSVDKGVVMQFKRAFEEISEITGLSPSFSDYTRQEGVLTLLKNDDIEIYREALDEALSLALNELDKAKEREGEGTYKDLKKLGEAFESSVRLIEEKAGEAEENFRALFHSRLAELKADKEITEERLNQEIALMLVKYSINEELKRLDLHIKEYFKLLDSTECVGKHLDFIAQEMTRETNTIASKSSMSEISRETIKMKDSIENIREQVRNIE